MTSNLWLMPHAHAALAMLAQTQKDETVQRSLISDPMPIARKEKELNRTLKCLYTGIALLVAWFVLVLPLGNPRFFDLVGGLGFLLIDLFVIGGFYHTGRFIYKAVR
ncbi:MAG: hypothetical protein ACJ789_21265 [Thermomicrobiales bacterium]